MSYTAAIEKILPVLRQINDALDRGLVVYKAPHVIVPTEWLVMLEKEKMLKTPPSGAVIRFLKLIRRSKTHGWPNATATRTYLGVKGTEYKELLQEVMDRKLALHINDKWVLSFVGEELLKGIDKEERRLKKKQRGTT